MELSGERYAPGLDWPEVAYEHWHRYLIASAIVSGKTVLEVGCGEGNGVSFLARLASRIVGVDVDPRMIESARAAHAHENVEFRCGSADAIPIDGEDIFDVLLSLEAIEFLNPGDQAEFLRESKRLLKPDGIAIVATPNPALREGPHDTQNAARPGQAPHTAFFQCLKEFYDSVHVFAQNVFPTSYIWPIDDSSRTYNEHRLSFVDGRFTSVGIAEKMPHYLIAFCSDRMEEPLPASILLDLSQRATKARARQIDDRGREIQNLIERIAASEHSLKEATELHQNMSGQIHGLLQRVESLQAREFELASLLLHAHKLLLERDQELASTLGVTVLYVVGGSPSHNPAVREFPLVNRRKGESEAAHLKRVARVVDAAMAAGGTHLLVPREQADWLGDHPWLADYFTEQHEFAEASAETGIVFALRSWSR
jgi:SAM-dependent methyltransferase